MLLHMIWGAPDDLIKRVRVMVGMMTRTEATIIRLRYGFEYWSRYSLEEVATMLGIKQAYVRQIEQTAMRRLQRQEFVQLLLPPQARKQPSVKQCHTGASRQAKSTDQNRLLSQNVQTRSLSLRIRNRLKELSATTYRDVTERTAGEFLRGKKFGPGALVELERHLEGLGLRLENPSALPSEEWEPF